MRKAIPYVLGVTLAVAGSLMTAAQEPATMPKILQVQREILKPGKAGAIHDKSESAFVDALRRAKIPTRYVALNSLSGRSSALYIFGYDSFADWQKSDDAIYKNAALAAAIDHATQADGELLDSFDGMILSYRDDLSYRPRPDLTNQRYIEIVTYHIRPGFGREWAEELKAVIEAHKKGGTNANWAMYQLEYGGNEGVYVLFSGDTGMDEIDTGADLGQKFRAAMGDDGLKKMTDVTQRCVLSSESQIFAINPKQSYPPDSWVKGNPDFWKPKAAAAAKPATAPADDKKPAK